MTTVSNHFDIYSTRMKYALALIFLNFVTLIFGVLWILATILDGFTDSILLDPLCYPLIVILSIVGCLGAGFKSRKILIVVRRSFPLTNHDD